jgi:hypothetical protein
VDPHDEDLLVVGAVEDPDASPLRKVLRAPPHEVVVEVFRGGRLEGHHLTSLGVQSRHDVLDRAVLPGRVHRLEDQQERPPVLGVEHVLELREPLDAHLQGLLRLGLVLGFEPRRVGGVDVVETKALAVLDPVPLRELPGALLELVHAPQAGLGLLGGIVHGVLLRRGRSRSYIPMRLTRRARGSARRAARPHSS